MNASSFDKSSDIDYFMTNVDPSAATAEWIVTTYSQRNWVEVFYREAKGWLRLKEYQVRDSPQSAETFYSRVLCLHFHFMAHLNRRTNKKVGADTFKHLS